MKVLIANCLCYLAALAILISGIIESYREAKMESTPEDAVWTLLNDDTTATVYNAVPDQCNEDFLHTASMYTIDTQDILGNHIVAMERTMMAEYGIQYGDVIKVEGAGPWDGLWQVQDTMNKRYAGQHKIDFLVPNHIRHGKWTGVKIYLITDKTKDPFSNTLITSL